MINRLQISIVSSTSVLAIAALPQPAFGEIAESWSIGGDVAVEATNTGAAVALAPESGVVIGAAEIADGSRNAISASAMGASAAVAYNTASAQDITVDDTADGAITASATNSGGAVSLVGTVDGAVIDLGHDNGISLSAVGASVQFGLTDDVLGGVTMGHALAVNGDASLRAENSAAVTLQTDVTDPQINGGTRNAVSGTAVGASAGLAVLAVVDDGTYSSQILIADGGQIDITAINSGNVAIGSTDNPAQPATLSGATIGPDSVDSNISMMAIGASGSVSSTTVVYSGSADPNVTFGDIALDVENSGAVSGNVSITDLTLSGQNAISVGAVGASTSASWRTISYAGDGTSMTGSLGGVSFGSSNSGAVLSAAGISSATISGFGVAIAATAVGASAAFTLP